MTPTDLVQSVRVLQEGREAVRVMLAEWARLDAVLAALIDALEK